MSSSFESFDVLETKLLDIKNEFENVLSIISKLKLNNKKNEEIIELPVDLPGKLKTCDDHDKNEGEKKFDIDKTKEIKTILGIKESVVDKQELNDIQLEEKEIRKEKNISTNSTLLQNEYIFEPKHKPSTYVSAAVTSTSNIISVIEVRQEIQKIKNNISKIIDYLNLDKTSKTIMFTFGGYTVTWILEQKHLAENCYRIIINPVPGNTKIYQVFYYNEISGNIGIKEDENIIKWYKIDYKTRVAQYPDKFGNQKYVYYKFINIEKEIE